LTSLFLHIAILSSWRRESNPSRREPAPQDDLAAQAAWGAAKIILPEFASEPPIRLAARMLVRCSKID
jgi:hypothetical protein